MKHRMSGTLELWVDEIIGMNWQVDQNSNREAALTTVLAFLEAQGDAQRVLTPKGTIKWIATRQLRDHIRDLQRDAEDDIRHADEARGLGS
jgi:hypothetical protein